jgi:hypothetical protein
MQPSTNDPINLHDWNQFVGYFAGAGVDLGYDTTDPDDGRTSQNVVHQYPESLRSGELCSLWKRIDFERLSAFVHDQKAKLTETLRYERYDMVRLAVAFLRHRKYGEPISDYDLGRLVQLICDFRRSSPSHYAFAFGSAKGDIRLTGESQTLLQ